MQRASWVAAAFGRTLGLLAVLAGTQAPLRLVAGTIGVNSPCILVCAGPLPNAVTQLGLIPAPASFPPNGVTFDGDGGSQATVQILNAQGDVIGAASAAGASVGASGTTSVTGGQLNNFGSVNAAAGVTIDPEDFATASASTKFDFWLQLVSPVSVQGPVPLIVTDQFDVSFTPGGANAVAMVKVSGDFGASQPLLFADEFFNPVNTSVSHTILVPPDAIIQVEMVAQANEFAAGGGMATAHADPTFQVDPSFPGAGSFSFLVSPNLAPAVPEPATVWTAAICLGAMVLLASARRVGSRRDGDLQAEQIGLQLGVAVFRGPEVEGERRQFVHFGHGQAVASEVNGLDVGTACIAGLHANVRELRGGIDRELLLVFLAAVRTEEAAEFPLVEA